jgi:phage tail P2-like protein
MIKRLLPPSLAKDETLNAIAESLDTQLQKVWEELINVVIYPRIDEIDNEELLDLLGWQFHIEGWELAKTVEEKRKLIKSAIELHRYKGTPYAIKKVLEALGLQGEVKEWFEYGGESYYFKVFVSSIPSEELWQKLIALIHQYKNERSWLDAVGIHNEIKNSIYVASALKQGKHYRIGLYIDPKAENISIYHSGVVRTSRQTTVGVHKPEINTQPGSVHIGTAFRVARIITIHPA